MGSALHVSWAADEPPPPFESRDLGVYIWGPFHPTYTVGEGVILFFVFRGLGLRGGLPAILECLRELRFNPPSPKGFWGFRR